MVATYSITHERKELVTFAGPYLLSQQGVMVRASDRDDYRTLSDLWETLKAREAALLELVGTAMGKEPQYDTEW
ncbi:MAG: hypothetical protein ACRDSQ_10505 [Actinokineospora sp.]